MSYKRVKPVEVLLVLAKSEYIIQETRLITELTM